MPKAPGRPAPAQRSGTRSSPASNESRWSWPPDSRGTRWRKRTSAGTDASDRAAITTCYALAGSYWRREARIHIVTSYEDFDRIRLWREPLPTGSPAQAECLHRASQTGSPMSEESEQKPRGADKPPPSFEKGSHTIEEVD